MYRLNPDLASDPSRRDLLPEWGPREKLRRGELRTLSERELLCLILGRGSGKTSVFELAELFEGLIFRADGSASIPSLDDCLQVKGLGSAKASAVLAGSLW